MAGFHLALSRVLRACARQPLRLALALLVLAALTQAAPAQPADTEPGIGLPALWPLEQRMQRPDASRIRSVRFLTESDYPPFNYIDERGELVGFNVELAAAICRNLKIECSMKTREWDKLFSELDAGGGDAIIASIAITVQNRARVDFTDRYYLTPARFAVKRDSDLAGTRPGDLKDRKIAVKEGTAHEAYLKAFFAGSTITPYKSREEARAALKAGEVDALFGDGVSLSFWLHGSESEGCCAFRGGPYLESYYFGEGVGIAVRKGNDPLRRLLNYALRQVFLSGEYEEIFLKYLPVSFY